ncbi:MAG: alpha/beta fold hydrolase [Leptospiraceae bacterium]|nr:alpha/beta fold hydrolase [Leptospiraceae bacterium]MDW8307278.1 YqiA/YcfP family alpha/beta fold hydrolase [Leptospiraceae bacterium]
MQIIYLHGMGSSPKSGKALFFKKKFHSCQIPFLIPDYNKPDFASLTVSRMVEQTLSLIRKKEKYILIGSSLGGYAAVHVAELSPAVKKLVLLAPAFELSKLSKLTPEEKKEWKKKGYRPYFHYAYEKEVVLHYAFAEDARLRDKIALERQIPCLIFHGFEDDVVPYEVSLRYAQKNTAAELILLHGDHQLSQFKEAMWQKIRLFLNL